MDTADHCAVPARAATVRRSICRSADRAGSAKRGLDLHTAMQISESAADRVRERVDTVYRLESRRVLATLIRLLGDFDLAEDALQDAFAAAVEQWPRDG